jgi:hypothetical protein
VPQFGFTPVDVVEENSKSQKNCDTKNKWVKLNRTLNDYKKTFLSFEINATHIALILTFGILIFWGHLWCLLPK